MVERVLCVRLAGVDLRLRHRRARRDVAEEFGDLLLRGRKVDVAGEHEHGVVRAVPGAEPVLHVLQRRRVEVVHRPDRGVVVRVRLRIHQLAQLIEHLPVGLVLAFALFVLHHAALLVERRLVDGADQVAHAIGFHPQRGVERGGGHVFEVVGAVGVRRAVEVGGADGLQRREEIALVVFRPVEHQVLEQVREARAARGLVLAAHVVPDVHRHDRRLVVGVHDHAQAVGQGEGFVRDVDLGPGRRIRMRGRGDEGRAAADGEGQGEREGAGGEGMVRGARPAVRGHGKLQRGYAEAHDASRRLPPIH
jgi:hypothetical protein